jgi:hypothetical protein
MKRVRQLNKYVCQMNHFVDFSIFRRLKHRDSEPVDRVRKIYRADTTKNQNNSGFKRVQLPIKGQVWYNVKAIVITYY